MKTVQLVSQAITNLKKKQFRSTGIDFHDLVEICEQDLPSGSGFNNGSKIDWDRTDRNQVVMHTSFLHMDDAGYYVGWTHHMITISPSWDGLDIRISGIDENGIKDYIADAFLQWAKTERDWLTGEIIDA